MLNKHCVLKKSDRLENVAFYALFTNCLFLTFFFIVVPPVA
ncbi:hypothetical protein ALT1000_40084 [Alteromonas macleodii]